METNRRGRYSPRAMHFCKREELGKPHGKYTYTIYISRALQAALAINTGDTMLFMTDADNIYFRKAQAGEAYTAKVMTCSHRHSPNPYLRVKSSPIVRHALRLAGAQKTVNYLVAHKTTMVKGQEFYQLLTTTPINVD